MKLQLNEKHLDNMALAMRDETRLLVAEGTVRSSKTVTLINIFYNEVKASKERLHLLAAKDYDAIRDNLLECNGLGLLDLHKDVKLVKPKIGSYYLVLKGLDKKWKKVLLAGYSNKDQWKKILGKTLGVILVDEVNTAKEQFIDETFARQVSAERPLTLFSLNGDNPKHFIYQKYINHCKPLGKVPASILADMNPIPNKRGYYYYHWTMKDNPVMTPAKIQAAMEIYEPGSYYYTIKILGERGIAEGIIYRKFVNNTAAYILTKVPRLSSIVLGVDFGGNGSYHSFVATGIGPNFEYVVHLESVRLEATGMDPNDLTNEWEQFVLLVQDKYHFKGMNCYCDSAEQTLMNGFKKRSAVRGLGVVIKDALKSPINDRIYLQNQLFGLKKLFFMEWATSCIDAYKTAVYDSRPEHINERLDNGTSDIDTMDASEYTIEPFSKQLILKM